MKSNQRIFKIIHLLLAFMFILLSTSPTIASQPFSDLVLIRIDLSTSTDTVRLANLDIPIHARIYVDDGELVILTFANPDQIETLVNHGFAVRVLEQNPQGKDYFLVQSLSPETEFELRSAGTPLDKIGDQTLVAISPEDFERFSNISLSSKFISPQPITVYETAHDIDISASIEPDPAIQALMNQITERKVYSMTGGLTGEWPVDIGGSSYTIASRNTGNATAIEKATQYAYEFFDTLELDVSYHNYTLSYYGSRRNVEAVQEGVSQPERIFLLTGHIDNMPSGPLAPGADDNGSGSVGVMLAAEVLSQYDFDCTLRYVLFSGEEQGLYGSHYYAQDAANARDAIEAVLNLDMIAYNSDRLPILDLHTRNGNQSDLAIANTFVDVVEAYYLDLVPNIHQDNMGYSDHDSFWNFGYPAILAIEDDHDFTPYYHTVDDNLDSLNMDYYTNFIQAAIGTFAHMGCLLPPDGTVEGVVTEAVGSTPLADALIEVVQSEQIITTTLSDQNGVYSLTLPAGPYTFRASKVEYIPEIIADFEIERAQTKTLDFSLDFCEPITGADFTISPPNAEAGEMINFISEVTGGTPPISISWDFDDGTIGLGETIQHTFVASNTYQIEMIASNCNLPISVTHPLIVSGYPAIQVNPDILEIDLDPEEIDTSILLIRNSGGDTLHWNISDFPEVDWLALSTYDGQTLPSTSTGVVLTFTAPTDSGVYTITLQISSNDSELPQVDVPITLTVYTRPIFLPIIVKEIP